MKKIILGIGLLFIVQIGIGQFVGGPADGHAVGINTSNLSFYLGGEQDGYAHLFDSNETSFYLGGDNDGYNSNVKLFYFFWIGAINFKWEESGNWANNSIPTTMSRVIIPDGVPNYPIINNQLSIGSNPNTHPLMCKELFIERGASINFTTTGFIENYGNILIGGDMIINNLNPFAFQNKGNATIKILNLGRLIFE